MEVSAELSGPIIGIESTQIVTYASQLRPDGTLYGEGQGVLMTADGDAASFVATGAGRFIGPGGAVSYRGVAYYQTAAEKLSRLNGMAAVFEYDVDGDGNVKGGLWEWK